MIFTRDADQITQNGDTHQEPLRALSLEFTEDMFILHTADGARHQFAWHVSPRLLLASAAERATGTIMPGGVGIEWEVLDEHLSTQGLLNGHVSQESWRSVVRWLELREAEVEDRHAHQNL